MQKFKNILFVIISTLVLANCGGGGGGGSEPAPVPTPPPAPTSSISASVESLRINQTAELTWSSTNATSCTASGDWSGDKGSSGTEEVQVVKAGTSTYSINCSGATSSVDIAATLDVDVEYTTETDDYGKIEISVSGYMLATDQTEDIQLTQISGSEILWLEKPSVNSFSARAPIVNASEDIQLQVTFGLSGIGETVGSTDLTISVVPQRDEILGLSLSESPGGSKEDGWATMYTDKYASWNFPAGVIYESETWSGRYCYPTPSDCYDGDNSIFGLASPNYGTGDFNGDGHEDLLLAAFNVPRHLDELTYPDFVILLNDGNGRLKENKDFYADGVLEAALPYRLGIADFNGDGLDDFVSCSRVVDLNDDYTYNQVGDVYDLYLTNAEGKIARASDNIDTSDPSSRSAGCHDTSVGDANGDGFPDFFISGKLFLNDGNGNFSFMKINQPGPMSSNIVDVNGDGYGDLVYHFGDPSLGQARGGQVLVSNGTDNFDMWEIKYLPQETFIGNTKQNDSNFGDLDGDGDLDLVIGNTRENPYYDGRKVSVLINDGEGNFTDGTSSLMPYIQSREPTTEDGDAVGGGEGNIYVRDWDGDGNLDIIDAWQPDNGTGVPAGVMVFINKIAEDGTFHEIDQSYFPEAITSYAMTGREGVNDGGLSGDGYITVQRGAPINLDNQGNLDFVVHASSIGLNPDTHEGSALFFYSLISTEE
jgi:hypothetical protein